MMTTDRNAYCPCGSGKKYKKCCMQKNQHIHSQRLALQKYDQLQKQLRYKLHDYLEQRLSLSEISQLKAEFKSRVGVAIDSELFGAYFNHWLYYYRKDRQGKRSCELFYEQEIDRLSLREKQLAKQWIISKPQLVQAKELYDEGLLVSNILTKQEILLLQKEDNSPILPWSISICQIVDIDGKYVINGMASWEEPIHLLKVKDNLTNWSGCTNGITDQSLLGDKFPEILGVLLRESNNDDALDHFDEITLTYKLDDTEAVSQWFLAREEMVIQRWNGHEGVLNWIEDWHRYEDTLITSPIDVGRGYGSIDIKDNMLIFKSFFPDKVSLFQTWMEEQLSQSVFLGEKLESYTFSNQHGVQSLVVKISPDIPKAFALYAQSRLLLQNLQRPLPLLNGESIEGLAQQHRIDEINIWLQEQEYMSQLNAFQQFGHVQFTEDFNWIREQFGLAKSHFVTEYESRKTMLNLCPKYGQSN